MAGVVSALRAVRYTRRVHLDRRVLFAAVSTLAAGLTLGCGAKTGLSVPDTGPDAPFDAPFDAPRDTPPDVPIDACVERTIPLTPVRPEVMFVLDRSTSMGWALTGPDGAGPTRYAILRDALAAQLPRYDDRSDMGLLLYPAEFGSSCSAAPEPQLTPIPGNASALLAAVNASGPGGRTPTAEALAAARTYFVDHPDATRARAVVLATDGAPNCNAALDGARCPCTGGAGLPVGACGGDAELCLDDVRTISVIEALAAVGVPTYVIGIDGDPDPALAEVLSRMASAGERPNPLDPERGFYSVRRATDLAAAFDRIQASIVSCTLSLSASLPTDRAFVVTFDGAVLPRDATRTEGWEVGDIEGTVVLYGEACMRAQEGVHVLEVEVLCSAR